MNHIERGKSGELLAAAYLEQKQYQILEFNWRFSRAEVDLIAKDGEILVFVEVKTRSYDYYGPAEAFVTAHKETMMIDAAHVYMEKIKHDWAIRFDVIGVLLHADGKHEISHIEDAFFPSW